MTIRTAGLLCKGAGWVAFSKLGVDEFDSRARFYAAPNEQAKVVLSLEGYGDKTVAAPRRSSVATGIG